MKICIVVRVLWPGGVQRVAFAEANGLRRLGHDVDLIFIRDTGRVVHEIDIPYKALHSSEASNRPLGRIFRAITRRYAPERGYDATVDFDLIYSFERYRKRYDVVIYLDEFAAMLARYGKWKHHDNFIVHLQEIHTSSLMWSLILYLASKSSSAIITSSNRNVSQIYSSLSKQAYLIRPGLNLVESIAPFNSRSNFALSVTMWDRGRHPEVFIPISRIMKIGKICLAGSWADKEFLEEFKQRVISEDLSDRLFVTGEIPEDQLQKLYQSAKVFVRFGYKENGPGMGSLESIAHGLPLIVNSGIGVAEIVKDDVNGYIVNERESADIANRIETLFTDEETWQRFSLNNKSLARQLSWDTHCKDLENIIKKVGHDPLRPVL